MLTPVTKTNCSQQQSLYAAPEHACVGSIQVGRLIEPITCDDIQVSDARDGRIEAQPAFCHESQSSLLIVNRSLLAFGA